MGHGLVYVAGTVVQSGLGLLLLPVVTRVLGVEEYGLAGTAAAVAVLLSIVYGLGISYSIIRFYYDDPARASRAGWGALLRAQLLIGAALAAITFATGPLWASAFEDFGWNGALQAAVVYGWAIAHRRRPRACCAPRADPSHSSSRPLPRRLSARGSASRWRPSMAQPDMSSA
jgi:O-antigen/teichoic acid export membrane protein